MKQISCIALGLLTLLSSQIHSEPYETKETIVQQNALVKEIEQICTWFFESENRKALDNFRFDEAAMIKSIDGTPEEVKAAFKAMYLTHALCPH